MSRPFRFTFILSVVVLATALAAVGGWRYARASAPVNGPIILLSIDALRADRLPIYGYKQIATPAIDALAADGIVFDRAYTHVPQTLPAHAAILTGRLPFDNGVRDSAGFVLKDDERLLAEMLRDRGFATGAVVSNYALRRGTGLDQGFTFYDDVMDEAPASFDAGDLRRSGVASETTAEQWLDGEDTSRLFLFLHIDESRQPGADSDQPAGYDDSVTGADAVVGRLIRYLKAHQLYDRSTIILVSDHGSGLGNHGEKEHGLLVYDETLRVPLVIKLAASEGAGRRIKAPVQHIDLVPTILDLAKAPTSGHLGGRSLMPVLQGNGQLEARTIYSESLYGYYHFGWSGLTTVTDGRYRYIAAPREELYDLDADPAAQTNLVTDAGPLLPVLEKLRAGLERLLPDIPLPAPADVAADERERIQALGYVGVAGAFTGPRTPIDPKDKVAFLEQVRAAVRLGASRQWIKAADSLRTLLRAEPGQAGLWRLLATYTARSGHDEQSTAALKRMLAVDPNDFTAHLDAAAALHRLHKLDEAYGHASYVANSEDAGSLLNLAAHIELTEIALARRSASEARDEAVLVREIDSRLPLPDYVEGRLLFDRGRASDAWPFFENALTEAARPNNPPLPNLHHYAGETLDRMGRHADAAREFLAELQVFPRSIETRAALALTYGKLDQKEEAGKVIADLVRMSPTPGAYATAARLWERLGDVKQAAATRTDARRLFGQPATLSAQ